MTQKQLIELGYEAAQKGLPCEAPTSREQDRGAWEQGYRAGKAALREERQQMLMRPGKVKALDPKAFAALHLLKLELLSAGKTPQAEIVKAYRQEVS
jgi:hypothetical protein